MRSVHRSVPLAFLFSLFLGVALPTRALVITPVWDSTIASDPNAAVIEGTINSAIQFYETRLGDPMSVTIEFAKMGSGLGYSQWGYYTIPYSQYYNALQSDAKTTNDAYALTYLPGGFSNPVTGDPYINVRSTTLKALGFGFPPVLSNGYDGVIFLNTSIMSLSRTNPNPSAYDLLAVTDHEIDEVLGLGSWLGTGLTNSYDPFPEDLFRYSSSGGRSFTTNGDDAFFSLDGANFPVQFNQQSSGDYGDWWSSSRPATPRAQDAFTYSGDMPNPNIELVALDVIGYDLLPAPRPRIVSIALFGTNLVVNGTNGLATGTYHLLTSTNLGSPLGLWTSVWTNYLTTNGNFTFTATNVVTIGAPRRFFALQLQQ